MSDEHLRKRLIAVLSKGPPPDVTLVTLDGKEVQAHIAVLAAQSRVLLDQVQAGSAQAFATRVDAFVRFLYCEGPSAFDGFSPCEALDLLALAQDLGVDAVEADHVAHLVSRPPGERSRGLPGMGPTPGLLEAVDALLHEFLQRHPRLLSEVCSFVGEHFVEALQAAPEQMGRIPGPVLVPFLRSACSHIGSVDDSQKLIRFCLEYTQLESTCDLLKESKKWIWGSEEPTPFFSSGPDPGPTGREVEWSFGNLREALESVPERTAMGDFFDWRMKLDYGGDGRLRIIYEAATPRAENGENGTPARLVDSFPAATFAWRVVYRGQDVFNEKPVFICFPGRASLHWSTTLPIYCSEIGDADELRLIVNMAENPMISLILSYFKADIKSTIESEDILNRLPHIEYRCLSSYMLMEA